MKKKIFLIGTVIFIILICITMYVFNKTVLNNEVRDTNIIESSVEKETTEIKSTREKNSHMFAWYFDYIDDGTWVWLGPEVLDYFTDNFKNKYSNEFDIYPDVQNSKRAWTTDTEELNDKGDKIRIEFTWEVENGKKRMSRVDYELTLTDDEKIDDCRIINVIYYDPVTHNPLDGRPITLNIEDVKLYIGVLWRPSRYRHDEDVADRIYKEYVDIPKSEDCKIINLPKEPYECEGSFPYFKATFRHLNFEVDYEGMFRDLREFKFKPENYDYDYSDATFSVKYYKIEYDLNDKAQFTRIEFKEITEDEYNERGES